MTFPLQLFTWFDAIPVILLIFLELLLSSDNAAILAHIIADLPSTQKGKALYVGIFSSFILRALGVLAAAYLIQLFWVQIVAGLYLIFLSIKHIARLNFSSQSPRTKTRSFLSAVVLIELSDIIFAIDSILGAFALVTLYYPVDLVPHKLWVVYLGGIIGLICVRLITTQVAKLFYTYRTLEKLIYLLIGWMGLKLTCEGIFYFFSETKIKELFDFLFWMGSLLIVIIGFLSTKWHKKV